MPRRLIAAFDPDITDEIRIRQYIDKANADAGVEDHPASQLTIVEAPYGHMRAVLVIGYAQAVMFAIGAVAAQGFDSLLRVE